MTTRRTPRERLTRTRRDREEGHRLLGLLRGEATRRAVLPGIEEVAAGFAALGGAEREAGR